MIRGFDGRLRAGGMLLALLCCGTLVGCFGSGGYEEDGGDGENGRPTVEIEFPEGDPSVPPEDGGPGFTGEGWTTVEPYALGDSKALKGGAITTRIREWPGNLRRLGTESNTWLNYTIGDLVYQGLLTVDPNTLEFIPMLASHWKVSEDRTTFTFRIDPRAHWTDGKPVVAEDVVASWRIRMDETLLSPSSIITYGKLEEPVAKSKYIVEVKAKSQNWRNFLYFATMSILPAHQIGDITGEEYRKKFNYVQPVSTGPYVLYEEDIDKQNKTVTLTRREDFWAKDDLWNRGMYNFDKIRFTVVTDEEITFQKMIKGELDYYLVMKAEWWAKDLPAADSVKKNWLVRQKVYNAAPNGTGGFAINMRNAPLDDVRLRKALQYLYDRDTLIETLAFNEYTPLNSYYAGGPYENPENEKIGYDQKAAVALLEEAGWTEIGGDGIRTKDGKRLSLKLAWYSDSQEKFLTSFKETCEKVGVEIVLDRTNPETLWKNFMAREFQMASIQWGALVFPNPETSFKSELADVDDTNNITGFKSERCDELFKEYDVAFSQEERVRIIQEIDGLVYEQHPYVLSWYQPCQRVMYWNKFGMPEYGFHRVLEWEDAFATWWLDPEKKKALDKARKAGDKLPAEPLEIRYWEKKPEVAEAN